MVNYTGRGLVVKRPGVLSKAQMLNLVIAQAPTIPLTCDLSGVLQNTKTPSSVEIRKKYEKIAKSPFSDLAPKIRKNTGKITKTDRKCLFFCIFFVFLGPNRKWGISQSFRNFFRISTLEGFLYSVAPQRDRNH